jgi:hypothetical protein
MRGVPTYRTQAAQCPSKGPGTRGEGICTCFARNKARDGQMQNALVEERFGQLRLTIDQLHALTVGLRKAVLNDQPLPGAVRSYMGR